jgi:hypothetical protein
MKFDIYGRFQLEVVRQNDRWVVYRLGLGTRAMTTDIFLPPDLNVRDLAVFLGDHFHEYADSNQSIREL